MEEKPVMFLGYEPNNIVFNGEDEEILRLEPDGEIFVHGQPVDSDKDVVDALKLFLTGANSNYVRKDKVIDLLDKLIDRSDRWVEDAEKRDDWNDVSFYSGQRKVSEELKGMVDKL
ncbi:hypothetical protein P59_111 [Bacillus phage P59]|nr:hypothetical protein P59_111 [Bacillus phage P59]